jgi:cytochrome c biogenesis protein CcmG, thiol:disulfide interchange protein DsbE
MTSVPASHGVPPAIQGVGPSPIHRSRLPLAYLVAAGVLPLILLALLVARLATVGGSLPAAARIGDPAPPFTLTDLNGHRLSLGDLRGRPVIVNFWASWCGPCIEEMPLLKQASGEHASEGLAIVGIVFQDRAEAARAFAARIGANWPAAVDPGSSVANAYGVDAPPASFFINRSGIVAGRQIGQLSAADLERQLAAILGPR